MKIGLKIKIGVIFVSKVKKMNIAGFVIHVKSKITTDFYLTK